MNRWPLRRRRAAYVPQSARPVVTYEPYPTGVGPWAGHESRCKCSTCR